MSEMSRQAQIRLPGALVQGRPDDGGQEVVAA